MFTGLRKLVIEGHQINRVTDFSCSFALIFLKTLTSLTITDADVCITIFISHYVFYMCIKHFYHDFFITF